MPNYFRCAESIKRTFGSGSKSHTGYVDRVLESTVDTPSPRQLFTDNGVLPIRHSKL